MELIHQVVRIDNMSGTTDGSQLRSLRFYNAEAPAAIDNGMLVKLVALEEGEREVYKAVAPAAGDKLNALCLVATPEVMADPRKRNLTDFFNEAGAIARGYMLHPGFFSCTKGCFDKTPKVGDAIEVMSGTTFKVTTGEATGTQVGVCRAIEQESGYTYYVVEIL